MRALRLRCSIRRISRISRAGQTVETRLQGYRRYRFGRSPNGYYYYIVAIVFAIWKRGGRSVSADGGKGGRGQRGRRESVRESAADMSYGSSPYTTATRPRSSRAVFIHNTQPNALIVTRWPRRVRVRRAPHTNVVVVVVVVGRIAVIRADERARRQRRRVKCTNA